MLGTMIPMLTGAFTAIMTAITPIFAAMAPILLPILAIAAIFGLIGLALARIRDAMGFTSVFDVMSLGIAHLRDGFGHIVNLIGTIVNFITGLVNKIGRFLGFNVNIPKIPKMDTNNAAREKVRLREKAEQAEIEKQQQAEQPPVNPLADLGTVPDINAMEVPPITAAAPPIEMEELRVIMEPTRRRSRALQPKQPEEIQTVQKLETIAQPLPVTTGEQIAETSAQNVLANMPATTENNVVNQVQTTNTSNSGNKQTTIIQGHRPSRTGDHLSSGYGRFAR